MATRLRLSSIGRRVVGWWRAVAQPQTTEAAQINSAWERPWLAEQMRFFAGDYTRRLTPLTGENFTGETSLMRQAYRAMMAEPVIKAAITEKIIQVARLGFQVVPQNKKDPREIECAKFVQSQIKGPSGTIYEWAWEVLFPGLTDGFSICEKLPGAVERGEWRGHWTIKQLKSKDTQWLQLEVDPYLNVTGIYAMRANYGQIMDPNDFVLFSHMKWFGFPTGNSDLRAAYRSAEMIKAAFRLRMILLDKFSGPFLVGKSADPGVRLQMIQQLQRARAQGWISLSDKDELEVLDLAANSGTDKFQEAIDDYRKDMVIAIQGSYLTMLEGQSNTRLGSSEEARTTAQNFVWWLVMEFIGCVNQQIIPDLVNPNYNDIAYPHLTLPEIDLERIKDQLEIKGILLNTFKCPISRSSLYELANETPPLESDALMPPEESMLPKGENTDEGGKPGFGQFAESRIPQRINEYEMYDEVPEFAEGSREPWQMARQECSVPGVPTNKVVQEYAEEDFNPAERVNLIAEILYGLFGNEAAEWVHGDQSNFAERRNWNPTLHPRDPGTGRFIPAGSTEAGAAAQKAIGDVLGGQRDAFIHEQILGHLNNLTVKQLRALHSQHGQKIPGRLRQEIVDGVLSRLPNNMLDRSTNRANQNQQPQPLTNGNPLPTEASRGSLPIQPPQPAKPKANALPILNPGEKAIEAPRKPKSLPIVRPQQIAKPIKTADDVARVGLSQNPTPHEIQDALRVALNLDNVDANMALASMKIPLEPRNPQKKLMEAIAAKGGGQVGMPEPKQVAHSLPIDRPKLKPPDLAESIGNLLTRAKTKPEAIPEHEISGQLEKLGSLNLTELNRILDKATASHREGRFRPFTTKKKALDDLRMKLQSPKRIKDQTNQ